MYRGGLVLQYCLAALDSRLCFVLKRYSFGLFLHRCVEGLKVDIVEIVLLHGVDGVSPHGDSESKEREAGDGVLNTKRCARSGE